MTVHDLCHRYGVKPATIHDWVQRGMPKPYGRTINSYYGQIHIEWIDAYLAIKHNNVNPIDALRFCKEMGWSLSQYVSKREEAIRVFGLGIA